MAGIPEGNLIDDKGNDLKEDKDKVKQLMKVMRTDRTVLAVVDSFECETIGQARDNSIRLIKVNVKSKATRDLILEKAPQLKESREPWKKVYVKKDVHPVYSKETSRIYKKMKELKENNPNKDIKIHEGKLLVDNKVIDRNLFFR